MARVGEILDKNFSVSGFVVVVRNGSSQINDRGLLLSALSLSLSLYPAGSFSSWHQKVDVVCHLRLDLQVLAAATKT